MLARMLTIGLLVELGIYSIILWRNISNPETPIFNAMLFIFAIALGIRAAILLGMFAISERWKCKRPEDMQIGFAGALRLFFAEYNALVLCYTLYHPVASIYGRLDPPVEDRQSGVPVLLVHGFFCNAAYWRPMLAALHRAGIKNTWTISLEPLYGDIERLTDQLAARVEEVCKETGAEKVALVGHSMGGLVSRAYARRPEGQGRVLRIVTLGSPHHGTVHAHTSHAKNARQMRIGNEWLNELNREEENPPGVPITSIFSYHDNIVAPQDSPILKHAENIPFAGIGHLEMSFSRDFQRSVIETLQNTAQEPGNSA